MSSRTGRVFMVTSKTRFDVSSAERWGDVVYIFDVEPSPFATLEATRAIAARLLAERWDARTDWIAMTGPLPLVVYAFCVAMDLSDEPVRALIFDARAGEYREREIAGLGEEAA